jgi:hypothetical protein
MTTQCQTLIIGGRVVDPRNGVDDVLAVGITDGQIVHRRSRYSSNGTHDRCRGSHRVSRIHRPALTRTESDRTSAAGIRWGNDEPRARMRCCSASAFSQCSRGWRAARSTYGYSASWLLARMIVMEGMSSSEVVEDLPTLPLDIFGALQAKQNAGRNRRLLNRVDAIIDLVAEQLDEGAIGVGVLARLCSGGRLG